MFFFWGMVSLVVFVFVFRFALSLARAACRSLSPDSPGSLPAMIASPPAAYSSSANEALEACTTSSSSERAEEQRPQQTKPEREFEEPWPPMQPVADDSSRLILQLEILTAPSDVNCGLGDLFADPIDGFQFEPGEEICLCRCGVGYRPESVAWLAETLGGHCVHCGSLVESTPRTN